MTPWQRRQRGLNSPRDIANLAAWYDVRDTGSMVIDGSNRVQLLADKSGNSAENVLALNGVAGNYASFTALTAFGAGNFSISTKATITSLAAIQYLVAGGNNAYGMRIRTDGKITAALFGAAVTTESTGSITALTEVVIGYTRSGTTGTYYINGIAAGTCTDNNNYTVGCSLLGAAGDVLSGFASAVVKSARVYSVALNASEMLADAQGAVQANCTFNQDFSGNAKLATSVTAATGQTVTINTTGDLGARICGARDYVNMTAAAQVGYTASDFSVSGDGTADYARTAPFPLPQAFTRISVIKQDTWTASDVLLDGANGANSGALVQTTTTPQLNINAGSSVAANTGLAVDTWAVVTEVFNGASSSLRIGRGVATTGNAGANAANGLTLFASGASTAAAFADGSLRAQAVYSRVLTRDEREALIEYFSRRTGVAL